MPKVASLIVGFGLLFAAVDGAESQEFTEGPDLSYADMADLALGAPIVALARVDRARRLDEERAVGVARNHVRFYVEAELETLIRSASAVPARVSYLVDVPRDADGRRPRIRDRQAILLAAPVPGRRGELQLIAPDAQLDWSEYRERTIRDILSEAASDDAPGIVTGVANAFSVPGTLPGESETQIFLATSDGRPVSLSVLRRPNQQPRWAVSLSEIVERASPPPAPNTLLWYRLACFLPDRLPEVSMENLDRDQIAVARADYRMVMDDLGPCPRQRG
ncbi:hypothetical protein HFP57_17665 [Parasphingopyxis algicola]|uniref:hypothetical protein n=1 Tax=Parasphingopyxis algicola TaxID=2026624 RepID=UPI0015A10D24|nr:hypothetical protein [Parasphingopyxis algicola]QLC26683.1 hypothetical protein HFP57_17665 [Parasphingopyxis algicola]